MGVLDVVHRTGIMFLISILQPSTLLNFLYEFHFSIDCISRASASCLLQLTKIFPVSFYYGFTYLGFINSEINKNYLNIISFELGKNLIFFATDLKEKDFSTFPTE